MGAVPMELREDGRIGLSVSFVEKDAVKAIPGSRWTEKDGWSLPGSWAACLAARATFGDRLIVGPRLAAWSSRELSERVSPALERRSAVDVPEGVEYDSRLFDFQQAGVHWAMAAGDYLLGDDMGSGKTVQACVVLREQKLDRGVIFAPKSVLGVWATHLPEWAGLSVVVADGNVTQRRKAIQQVADGEKDVVVMTWENAHSHSRLSGFGSIKLSDKEKEEKELDALLPRFVLCDEAHKLRNGKSRMTRAVWHVRDLPSVERAIAMTGTPVGNAIDDIWAIMRFVAPEEWPVKSKFVERHADLTWNQWGGMEVGGLNPQHAAEFYKVLDPRYRALPKSVTLPHLPPIRGGLRDKNGLDIIESPMSPKQARAYKQMAETQLAMLDSGVLVADSPMVRVGRQLQLSSAYADVEEYFDSDGVPRQKLDLQKPSCKLDTLKDLMEGELDGEEGIIVFTVSKQLAYMVQDLGKTLTKQDCGLITGDQGAYERTQTIEAFQAGKQPLIAVVVAAGGSGITLTKARVAVHLQRSYSFIDREQAEGRNHRIGSEIYDQIRCIDVITPNTCEMKVAEALYAKQDIASQVSSEDGLRAMLAAT